MPFVPDFIGREEDRTKRDLFQSYFKLEKNKEKDVKKKFDLALELNQKAQQIWPNDGELLLDKFIIQSYTSNPEARLNGNQFAEMNRKLSKKLQPRLRLKYLSQQQYASVKLRNANNVPRLYEEFKRGIGLIMSQLQSTDPAGPEEALKLYNEQLASVNESRKQRYNAIQNFNA